MPGMSEPPRELAALSVEELRAALLRQRAVNAELRGVISAQAELHEAELAARDALLAQLRSQVVATDARLRSQVAALTDRIAQLERQAGRDSSNSSKPPSSDSPLRFPRFPGGPEAWLNGAGRREQHHACTTPVPSGAAGPGGGAGLVERSADRPHR